MPGYLRFSFWRRVSRGWRISVLAGTVVITTWWLLLGVNNEGTKTHHCSKRLLRSVNIFSRRKVHSVHIVLFRFVLPVPRFIFARVPVTKKPRTCNVPWLKLGYGIILLFLTLSNPFMEDWLIVILLLVKGSSTIHLLSLLPHQVPLLQGNNTS